MKHADRLMSEGVHPRVLVDGLDIAKKAALDFLDTFKEDVEPTNREMLTMVARTSLRTKLAEQIADQLTGIIVDAVLCVKKEASEKVAAGENLDGWIEEWMDTLGCWKESKSGRLGMGRFFIAIWLYRLFLRFFWTVETERAVFLREIKRNVSRYLLNPPPFLY